MKKFEYKILTISTAHLRKKNFQAELSEKFRIWGDEGWELIKMEPISSGGFLQGANTSEFLIVFKKEKIQNE